MKIDCSKLSNKGDLAAFFAMLMIGCLFGYVAYLSATDNSFFAGFISASIVWKWKSWIYDPIERVLEKYWPFRE